MSTVRFLIAGTGSGSGKTTITLALISAFTKMNYTVRAFKCGPDYIDTSFHSAASQQPTINLDRWMMGDKAVQQSFTRWSENSDISLVEGVMGLFDGVSVSSSFGSSADMAALLNIPIILVVNAKGMARSFAALVNGFCTFDTTCNIIGVIANGVGSKYHASLLDEVLQKSQLPPLLGFMGRDEKISLPERHLGLVPEIEKKWNSDFFSILSEKACESLQIQNILNLSRSSPNTPSTPPPSPTKKTIKIGVAYDKAFSFYYEDNLELLRQSGAELIFFSPLTDATIPPECSLLYFGGGFPEIFAKELSANTSMLHSVKVFSKNDGAIYAECGGLMYLSKQLTTLEGITYSLCNIFPLETTMNSKLKKLGYREVTLTHDSFLGSKGDTFRGHEFHYSNATATDTIENIYCVTHPLKGPINTCGYKIQNTIASYIHLHWSSNKNEMLSFFKKSAPSFRNGV